MPQPNRRNPSPSTPASSGEIITFYSYKGGTGRTMALANVAVLLGREAPTNSVLIVDWDLEAPGLHRYFRDVVHKHFPDDAAGLGFDRWPGVLDLFTELAALVEARYRQPTEEQAMLALQEIPFDTFVIKTDLPGVSLLKAGSFNERYSATLNTFNWERLHASSPWLLPTFAAFLAERFRYVLIDSRTGLTDTGAICTSILPETLVLVFTPNRQSLLGAIEVAQHAAQFRKNSDDLRPLRILPLASRIEVSEPDLREQWRFGNREQGIPGYQPEFEHLFRTIYDLPSCDLHAYFSEIQIQHVAPFAYGEQIAARTENDDRLSLTRSFQHFAKHIVAATPPWLEVGEVARDGADSSSTNGKRFMERRQLAVSATTSIGASGMMEATFSLSKPLNNITPKQLLRAAESAQVQGTGWPIGAVLPTQRPRPTADGVEAEVIDKSTNSYDYWTLLEDGSFYFARNIEEPAHYLLADDRLDRVTELLLYCQRLYSFLPLAEDSVVQISVFFSGLKGRKLGCRQNDDPDHLLELGGSSTGDTASSEAVIPPRQILSRIGELARQLIRPLFSGFDFYELPDFEYERLIGRRLEDWGYGVKR